MSQEAQVLIELTEQEIKQVLGTAVKQMVRIAQEPASDIELETLASVISKCSKATKSFGRSHPSKNISKLKYIKINT